jgi:hypothetical protein
VADLPGDDEAQELKPALAEMIEALGRKPETSGDGRLDAATAQLDPGGQPQGTGQVARRFLNAATTLCDTRLLRGFGQWSGARAMIWDLRQVNRYLCRQEPDETGATLDQRIRGRLTAVMDDGPTIVVAHSLGTIVAYEALHENRCQTPLLVTLGSPLGMRTIVTPRLLPQPPRAPESVGEWRNFWDKDDPIAVRPRLENAVGRNSAGAIPCSRRVDSDSAWVHPATKYLEHPGVGGPIAHVLESYLG